MVWLFGSRYIEALEGQAPWLQFAVIASWLALTVLMVLMVFGAMGESIKRNWLARHRLCHLRVGLPTASPQPGRLAATAATVGLRVTRFRSVVLTDLSSPDKKTGFV